MAADPSGPDPKSLWQDQERETDPVTLDQIHAMVRRWDQRTRRAAVATVVILMFVVLVAAETWNRARDLVGLLYAVTLILGEAATFFLAWKMLYTARDPAEPAGAYLQRRLLLRLKYLNGGWLIAIAPLAPPVILAQYFMLTHNQGPWLQRLAPSLIVIVIVAYVLARVRQRRKQVQSQLDELEGLMGR
jgi:hypothetical protein